ncbi:MAG TPA: hypothetical protein VK364_09115 [Hymenobacter sp.]|nr:hypothetical protein [Hymenobacter sp.]
MKRPRARRAAEWQRQFMICALVFLGVNIPNGWTPDYPLLFWANSDRAWKC